jgi:ABC-type uncharacterized transport system involved in gliding motility auxiliary subunit
MNKATKNSKHSKLNWQKTLTIGTLLVAAVLFLAVNIMSNSMLHNLRLDFTENKLYTLSEGSKEILAAIKEPITLRLYFSKTLAKDHPYLTGYANRVKDLLLQYKSVAKGKIILSIIEPEPFTEEEDRAVNYGLQGVPVDEAGSELYFGLVATNATTGKEVIPFIQAEKEDQLEYDITKLIANLEAAKQKTIAVISSLPINGDNEEMAFMRQGRMPKPWVIWDQMQEMFMLKMLPSNFSVIPQDVKVLMLVDPKNLSKDSLRAIDRFVMYGGRVLAFLDPYSEVANSAINVMQEEDDGKNSITTLRPLLTSWGVKIIEDKVVAIQDAGMRIRYQRDGREAITNYPLWMDLDKKYFSADDILTSQLEKLTLISPGVIEPIEGASSKFVPLVFSSDNAMLVDSKDVVDYRNNPDQILRKFVPDHKIYTMASRITGTIKSAFDSSLSTSSANIVIMANADFLHDRFWVNIQSFMDNKIVIPTSGNGNFVLGALENLSGDDALISIRNRGSFARPFDKIRELQVKSQEKFYQKEQALLSSLEEAKKKLLEIEANKQQASQFVLSQAKQAEETKFREELIKTRKDLREVQLDLQKDIKSLEAKLKFYNIGLLPIVILFSGLFYWAYIVRVRKARYAKK